MLFTKDVVMQITLVFLLSHCTLKFCLKNFSRWNLVQVVNKFLSTCKHFTSLSTICHIVIHYMSCHHHQIIYYVFNRLFVVNIMSLLVTCHKIPVVENVGSIHLPRMPHHHPLDHQFMSSTDFL
jgi:hypothetical protein